MASRRTDRPKAVPLYPVVPVEHLDEPRSRRIFEDVIDPWALQAWSARDYGIDAIVQIMHPRVGTTDHFPGELLTVQLKSTRATPLPPVEVKTRTVRMWLRTGTPALVVQVDLTNQVLHGWWITDETLGPVTFTLAQKTITLPRQSAFTITKDALPSMVATMAKLRGRSPAIPPSKFFEMRERIDSRVDQLRNLGRDAKLASASLLAEQTARSLKTAPYMVALVGPPRVGKSSLANVLMRCDASPVADYPTTAVPVLFEATDEATAVVAFDDGTKTEVAATAEALRPYAAQQENAANERRVAGITVQLPNAQLARGFVLVDTPGLHDASEAVRMATQTALERADAVLFVLDASLGPKFHLGQYELADLAALGRKERLTMVLNQSDGIDDARRASLMSYVSATLQRADLAGLLAMPPIFVSARHAWEKIQAGQTLPPEFVALEDAVWGQLLRQKSSGFDRLRSAVAQLQRACEQCQALLVDRVHRGDIALAKRACEHGLAEAKTALEEWYESAASELETFVNACVVEACSRLEAELRAIRPGQALPTVEGLRARLQKDVRPLFGHLRSFLDQQLGELNVDLAGVVRRSLASFRRDLAMPATEPLPGVWMPPIELDVSLPEAGGGFFLGLLGFFVNPGVGFLTTLLGLLGGHDLARERRHKRVVTESLKQYRKAMLAATGQLSVIVRQRLVRGGRSLLEDAGARLVTFIDDAERRLAGETQPITAGERERLEHARRACCELAKMLGDDASILDAYR